MEGLCSESNVTQGAMVVHAIWGVNFDCKPDGLCGKECDCGFAKHPWSFTPSCRYREEPHVDNGCGQEGLLKQGWECHYHTGPLPRKQTLDVYCWRGRGGGAARFQVESIHEDDVSRGSCCVSMAAVQKADGSADWLRNPGMGLVLPGPVRKKSGIGPPWSAAEH